MCSVGQERCGEGRAVGSCFGPGHHWGGFFVGEGHGLTRSFIRPVVLLLLAENPYHGYELIGKLKEFGIVQGMMDPSILYRLLRHLERDGLAVSTLDDTGAGPARKVYALTPEGREVLDIWAASVDGVSSFLQEFKDRYQKLGKS